MAHRALTAFMVAALAYGGVDAGGIVTGIEVVEKHTTFTSIIHPSKGERESSTNDSV